MTRDEFAWLIVRAIGAFMLLLVFLDLVNIALMAVQAGVIRTDISSGSVSSDDEITTAIRYGRLINQMTYLGIELIPKTAFTYYCFKHGGWIHRLLTYRLASTDVH